MTEIGIVTTRLAHTDRRALSQAWYDAFYPHGTSAGAAPAIGAPQHAARPPAEPAQRGREPAPDPDVLRRATARSSRTVRPGAPVVERRGPADPSAQRFRRAVVQLTRVRARAAGCTVALGNGRVQLLLRTDAAGVRIVAVCAAAERERVARALAAARFALAGAGVVVAA